jgi:hypothetical protein
MPLHLPHALATRWWALAFILGCAGMHYWPYAVTGALPVHDTSHRFQVFHYFYSELLQRGEWPLWIPYATGGMRAAYYQAMFLSPSDYLVGAFGILFRIEDVLGLYNASMFLQVTCYLAGVYLFLAHFCKSTVSVCLGVVTAALTLSWFVQPYFNFLIFAYMPYVLLFLFKALHEGEFRFVLLAGVVMILSAVGNAPYLLPLQLLVITVVLLPTLWRFPILLRRLLWQAPQWVLPGLGVLGLGLLYVAAVLYGLSGNANITPGRGGGALSVPLSVFLEYGRHSPTTIAYGLTTGAISAGPNTFYVGLFSIAVIIWAFARRRQGPICVGLGLGVLVLLWLSLGGVGATLFYFFPGMAIFRHIGLVFGLADALLILLFGLCFDRLLLAAPGRMTRGGVVFVVVLVACIALDAVWSWRPGDGRLTMESIPLSLELKARLLVYGLAIVLAMTVAWRAPDNRRAVLAVLAAAFIFDLAVFQWQLTEQLPRPSDRSKVALRAEAVPWRNQRTTKPPDARSAAMWDALVRPTSVRNARYWFLNSFSGWDACAGDVRTDMLSESALRALQAMGATRGQWQGKVHLPDRKDGQAAFGCDSDKLWFASNVRWAAKPEDELAEMAGRSNLRDAPVIHAVDKAIVHAPETLVAGMLAVVGFSSNTIAVDVKLAGEGVGMLIYADAYDPGWTALVDGRTVPVLRADGGLKAVVIPGEAKRVELRYAAPLGVFFAIALGVLGLGLSGLMLALLLGTPLVCPRTGTRGGFRGP